MRKVQKTIANFQIQKSLKTRIEARARKEGISLACLLRRLIREYLADVKIRLNNEKSE